MLVLIWLLCQYKYYDSKSINIAKKSSLGGSEALKVCFRQLSVSFGQCLTGVATFQRTTGRLPAGSESVVPSLEPFIFTYVPSFHLSLSYTLITFSFLSFKV